MDRDRAEARLPVLGPRSRGAAGRRTRPRTRGRRPRSLAARRAWPLVATLLAMAVALAALALLRRQAADRAAGRTAGFDRGAADHLSRLGEAIPRCPPMAARWRSRGKAPRQDNLDIYLKLVGPGEPHRLTTDPAADFSPAWSPDGRQIAFLRRLDAGDVERCGIYLIPALGGAERRLAEIDLTTYPQRGRRLAGLDSRWQVAGGGRALRPR